MLKNALWASFVCLEFGPAKYAIFISISLWVFFKICILPKFCPTFARLFLNVHCLHGLLIVWKLVEYGSLVLRFECIKLWVTSCYPTREDHWHDRRAPLAIVVDDVAIALSAIGPMLLSWDMIILWSGKAHSERTLGPIPVT